MDYYANRGVAYLRMDDYLAAIHDFDYVIQYDPFNINGLYYKGQANQALGNIEEAILDYSETIELMPDHVMALFHRGESFFKLRALELSVKDFDKVIELDADLLWHTTIVDHLICRKTRLNTLLKILIKHSN